jgi:tRNA 2-thiouridine synthesizing protein E
VAWGRFFHKLRALMSTEYRQQNQRVVREIEGREIAFDGEGFVEDPDDWTESVAEFLAAEAGLYSMSKDHWRVLRFLREFYYQNGRAPLNKKMRTGLAMSVSDIEALFPGGIKYGARRLAGLPNPKSCM